MQVGHVPIDTIIRDRELSNLWVNDRLEREAAWSLMRAVVSAMEQAVDNPISRSRLPDTVHVRRIQDRAISRVVTEDGEVLLYDPRDDSLARVFPLNWSVFDLLLGNHTLDRGSVGASGANFMESH